MRIPRDNLVRAIYPGVEMRDAEDGQRTLTGHFAVFDQWTEINSVFEGRFLERISPGAFLKTFNEGRAGMKVLFQHGKDQQVGDKPIGTIRSLEEDSVGAHYDVGLFRGIPPLVMDGLEAGEYGASFRFSVTRDDVNKKAQESAFNPNALPERTIREAQVMEFGPVTFPAYKGATAGVRSMTDAFTLRDFTDNPEALRMLLDYNEAVSDPHATISVPADLPSEEDEEERKDFSADKRKTLAKKGQALPDGSFPIENEHDLKNAISAYGRAGNKAAAKAHIMKRARALGLTSLLPDDWKSSTNTADEIGELRARLAELEASLEDDAEPDEDEPDPVEEPLVVVDSPRDAPPTGAEAEPHPSRGRREIRESYLTTREEAPSWHL